MPYDVATDSMTGRPAWILGANMNHHMMKNDHRIPWNCLLATLNRAIRTGEKNDIAIVNSLMKMSPGLHPDRMKDFKVGLSQHKTGQVRKPGHVTALNSIEQLLFSLPSNISNGLNNRADDPGGDDMDFTPDDVDFAGSPTAGANGALQTLRETLFGLLVSVKPDERSIDKVCTEIVRAIGHANLGTATAANLNHWHPGPAVVPAVPRTYPGYRYFLKPGIGVGAAAVELTLPEVMTMIAHVTSRAKKLGAK
jgi:hypothetical protein